MILDRINMLLSESFVCEMCCPRVLCVKCVAGADGTMQEMDKCNYLVLGSMNESMSGAMATKLLMLRWLIKYSKVFIILIFFKKLQHVRNFVEIFFTHFTFT